MHNAIVTREILNIFKLRNWRAAAALSKALLAYERGLYVPALTHWERGIQVERLRTSEYMTFYALLMALNKRPAKEGLDIFRRVAAGEFRGDRPESRYAEALSNYWLAYLTGRSDIFERWLDAHKLRPSSGWVARALTLPKNPVDPAGRCLFEFD